MYILQESSEYYQPQFMSATSSMAENFRDIDFGPF